MYTVQMPNFASEGVFLIEYVRKEGKEVDGGNDDAFFFWCQIDR